MSKQYSSEQAIEEFEKNSELLNYAKGKIYNNYAYLEGDIYEKLEQLEKDKENISNNAYKTQREKLENILPKPKTVKEIELSPTSSFVLDFMTDEMDDEGEKQSLNELFIKFISDNNFGAEEIGNVNSWDLRTFAKGERLNLRGYTDFAKENIKSKLSKATHKVFRIFLETGVSEKLQKQIEYKYNREMRNYSQQVYKNFPIITQNMNAKFKGQAFNPNTAQIETIAKNHIEGSSLGALEVGVGKTIAGIISIEQAIETGKSKRPLLIVPKNKQTDWKDEYSILFPERKIIIVDNMSKWDGKLEDGTILIASYQCLNNLWYGEDALTNLERTISGINFNRQGVDKFSGDKAREKAREKQNQENQKIFGGAERGNSKKHLVDELKIDLLTVDEVHNFNKVFENVYSQTDSNEFSGLLETKSSARAVKLYNLAQHILSNNNNENVYLFSATPFTNNPIEIFSVLSMIGKHSLEKAGINNVHEFMSRFIDVEADWTVNHNRDVTFKRVIKGFKNLQELKSLLNKYILFRTADNVGVKRPNKYQVKAVINPNDMQKDIFAEAEEIALSNEDKGDVFRAISMVEKASLSPYIQQKNTSIGYKEFVENSPKIKYVVECIKTVVKDDAKSGQIIYMDFGIDWMPKIKEYLEKEVGLKGKVEIITANVKEEKADDIIESFNDPEGKIQVIIGSSKIKEGLNLNGNTSTLYDLTLDWNSTDQMQKEGRIHRQGNPYKNIRIVYPLLVDGLDSFIFQKLDEKSARLNALWSSSDTDYIDLADINPEEMKFALIKNPEKRAKSEISFKKSEIEDKIKNLEKQKDSFDSIKSSYKSNKEEAEKYADKVKSIEETIQKLKDENETYYSYRISNHEDTLKLNKNWLKYATKRLQGIEARIARNNININDRTETMRKIEAEIEDLNTKKAEIEKQSDILLEKYTAEREAQLKQDNDIQKAVDAFSKNNKEMLVKNVAEKIEQPEIQNNFAQEAEPEQKPERKTEKEINQELADAVVELSETEMEDNTSYKDLIDDFMSQGDIKATITKRGSREVIELATENNPTEKLRLEDDNAKKYVKAIANDEEIPDIQVIMQVSKKTKSYGEVSEFSFDPLSTPEGQKIAKKLSPNQKELVEGLSKAIKNVSSVSLDYYAKEPTLISHNGNLEYVKNILPRSFKMSKDGDLLVTMYRERLVRNEAGDFIVEPNADGERFDFRTYRIDRFDQSVKVKEIPNFIEKEVKYMNSYQLYVANQFNKELQRKGIDLDILDKSDIIDYKDLEKIKKVFYENSELWNKLCKM